MDTLNRRAVLKNRKNNHNEIDTKAVVFSINSCFFVFCARTTVENRPLNEIMNQKGEYIKKIRQLLAIVRKILYNTRVNSANLGITGERKKDERTITG